MSDDPITLEEIDRRIAAALDHFAATLTAHHAPEEVREAAMAWARQQLEDEFYARRVWLVRTRQWLTDWQPGTGAVQ